MITTQKTEVTEPINIPNENITNADKQQRARNPNNYDSKYRPKLKLHQPRTTLFRRFLSNWRQPQKLS